MFDTLVQQKRYSLEEYFALEERSEEKHEYHHGKIKTMPGGSVSNSQIARNIANALGNWIESNNLP
jgi:Uma2 family endonuclease